MTFDQPVPDKEYLNRALEVSIHICLFVLLVAACLVILRPFIAVAVWGLIISIAGYPGYCKLQKLFGGKRGLASTLFTVLLLTVLIVPIALLAQTLVDGFQSLAARLHNETLTIPPPPPNIATWPLLGKPLSDLWSLASNNLSAALQRLAPQLKAAASGLLLAALPELAWACCSFSFRLWLRDSFSPTRASAREFQEIFNPSVRQQGPRV